MTDLAARLYETVRQYAEIGAHHRTGTAEDARTLDWFEDRVRALGATTERQPWSFDRYDAEWRVTVDGAEVEALPLFYEGTGEIDSTAPVVAVVDAVSAGAFPTWPAIVADARSAGAPVAVVATRSPSGVSSRRTVRRLRQVQDCRDSSSRARSPSACRPRPYARGSPRGSLEEGRAISSDASAPARIAIESC